MKVLYLCHPEGDFGGSFIYNGLVEHLGKENVVDYPWKGSYHGVTHYYESPWYGAGNTGQTGVYQWMTHNQPDEMCWSKEQVEDMLRAEEFAFVVVESPRVLSMQALRELRPLIEEKRLAIVLAEGEDYSGFELDKVREIAPHIYLKRELRRNNKHRITAHTSKHRFQGGVESLVVGWPFSCPIRSIERTQPGESYDIFFSCGNTTVGTTEMRQRTADALREYSHRAGINSYVAIAPDHSRTEDNPNLMSWPQYIGCMRASRLLVNCRGFGYDTARHWEAAGAGLLVTETLGLIFEHEYAGMLNVVEFNSPEECVSNCEMLLADGELAGDIRAACMSYTRTYHTNEARAQKLVEIVHSTGMLKNG